eukprot:596996-Pyramimonas_sp.AAC.1
MSADRTGPRSRRILTKPNKKSSAYARLMLILMTHRCASQRSRGSTARTKMCIDAGQPCLTPEAMPIQSNRRDEMEI